MASTIGTALGSTQGSCRPRARRTVASPSVVTVSCALLMVAVGLKATRKPMPSPLEIPPLQPAGVIARRPDAAPLRVEGVVVLASREERPREPGADLESFGRRERQHGLPQVRLEAVEDGLAESRGGSPHHALDDAPHGVP